MSEKKKPTKLGLSNPMSYLPCNLLLIQTSFSDFHHQPHPHYPLNQQLCGPDLPKPLPDTRPGAARQYLLHSPHTRECQLQQKLSSPVTLPHTYLYSCVSVCVREKR